VPALAQAATPDKAVAIAKKLELLQRYLASSGSEQIAAGDNPTARALLERARERGSQAMSAYAKGQMDSAEERMAEAFRAYSEALGMQRGQRSGDAGLRARNAALRDEIGGYLRAFDEALLRKGPSAAALLNRPRADQLLAEAERLERNGDPRGAQAALDEAYSMAITALTRIRDNETVVYSLDFRTPADEYRYEQNRHQSYQLLVRQMQHSSELGAKALELSRRYADEGEALRRTAEAQAESGQFEAAIESLEQANKRMVRALQMLGLSIPG
jgi:tetratricopeptide (TPR) repeat protein